MAVLFEELKRRKVVKVGGLYLVGAWVMLEIASVVVPALFLPAWAISLVLYMLIAGFPVVLALSWYFDLTLEGLKRDAKDHAQGFNRLKPGLAFSLALAVMSATGFLSYDYLSKTRGQSALAPSQASIAVLPFANLTNDPAQQYFSDGVSDELINALARYPALRVVARSSSFRAAGMFAEAGVGEIASQLGVENLLEGSVRRQGNTVRVSAKLIRADNGVQVWSENFDREIRDIFAIQDEIANAIATALHVELTGEGVVPPTVPRAASIDAYNLYLLGRYHFEKRSVFELEQAQGYFESAIKRDPNYAPAYNGLVDTIFLLMEGSFGSNPREQSMAAAILLIDKSLALDPLMAETHASLGFLRFFERDLLAAEAALRRAIELNPNLSRAWVWLYIVLDQTPLPRQAFAALQRAFALDPLSPIVNTNMAAEYWIRGQTDEAQRAAERVIQIAPEGPLGYRRMGRIKWTGGKMAEAVGWYQQSRSVAPEGPNSKRELGALLVDLGLYEEAETLLGDQVYIAYLAQGHIDEALAIVRAALEQRPDNVKVIFAAANTEARAGNFERVRSLLEPLGEGVDQGKGPLFRHSGIHFWDPQIAAMDLAVARFETGDSEGGNALLSDIRRHFEILKQGGLDHPMLRFQEARILALEGRNDEALAVLRQAIAGGWRFWYTDGDPALKGLQEGREFHSLLADIDMLVAQERAKLD